MSDSNSLLNYSSAFGQPTSPDNSLAFTLPSSTASPSTPAGSSLVPDNYADVIGGHESGGRSGAQNPYFPVSRGGPLGPHQFTAETWKSFAKANPQLFGHMDEDQILAARTDPALSTKATNWYAGVNAGILQAAGIAPTPINLAIGHALGGAGAAGVLKFPDSMPLKDALLQSQPDKADAILAQNHPYQTITVGGLKAMYGALGGGAGPAGAPVQVAASARGAPVAVAPPPATPTAPNALSSLAPFSKESMDKLTPAQRLAMIQQLQQMFAPPRAQQVAQAGGSQVGGVDASIPLAAGRV